VNATPGMPRPPRTAARAVALLALAAAAAWLPLSPDITAFLSLDGLGAMAGRLGDYLAAFAAPDLSSAMLARCLGLAADTVAVALLGTAIGLLLAYPLALGACRAVVLPERATGLRGLPWRALLELCRFALDALRGVPDFVWAVLFANFLGVTAVTGVCAIAVSVAGIFGKVLSEQWDNVPPRLGEPLRATGAGRLAQFFYGVQPRAARTTLSFVLMRTECAVRNASVIGVVGGGGLGAALWEEYGDGDLPAVATILMTLLLVTAAADLGGNLVRRRLRVEGEGAHGGHDLRRTSRRRLQVFAGVVVVLVGCTLWLADDLRRVFADLGRIEWQFVRPYTLGLFAPEVSFDAVTAVLRASVVPVAIGVLSTLLGSLLAALLAYPASVSFQLDSARFTGERASTAARIARACVLVAARAVALALRAVPEAAWLVVLLVVLRADVLPCVLAIALHSAGVLHRVFTEVVDDVRYRDLERVDAGASRLQRFAYGALPRAFANWRSYVLFQFEVNVRAGVALGLVGAGGLGFLFGSYLSLREHARAAAFLWGMILLTVLIDRVSRWLHLRRSRC